jgi:hypothetical protein
MPQQRKCGRRRRSTAMAGRLKDENTRSDGFTLSFSIVSHTTFASSSSISCSFEVGASDAISVGSGASTAISRETALQQLGIFDPNPSKEQIQQAYQRMAVKWYEYYVHPWRIAAALGCPALRPSFNSKSLRPHHLQTHSNVARACSPAGTRIGTWERIRRPKCCTSTTPTIAFCPTKAVLCGGKSEN